MLQASRLFILTLGLIFTALPSQAAIPPLKELQKIKTQLLERRSALVSQSTHKKLQRIYSWIQKENSLRPWTWPVFSSNPLTNAPLNWPRLIIYKV